MADRPNVREIAELADPLIDAVQKRGGASQIVSSAVGQGLLKILFGFVRPNDLHRLKAKTLLHLDHHRIVRLAVRPVPGKPAIKLVPLLRGERNRIGPLLQ